MNSAATSHFPHQQGFKISSTSPIDTFRRISLPGDVAGMTRVVADDVLPAPLDLNAAYSSQSSTTHPDATTGHLESSHSYLSLTGSIETVALRELQAFAGQGGMDHVSIQSPDTTDSVGCQSYVENSGIGQSTNFVSTGVSSRGLKESPSSPYPSICTMCGRGCECQKRSEDTVCRQMSQEATNSQYSDSEKVDPYDTYDYKCEPQSPSPLALLSSLLSSVQQQQSCHSDIRTDETLLLTPTSLELSITLHELSVAAREPFTGSIADLIKHTIQAVVDAHIDTNLYTSDKVAAGLREYELMLSTKPPVSSSVYTIIVLNLLLTRSKCCNELMANTWEYRHINSVW